NKAFLEVGGKKIIDRTAELFQEIFSQVILVTNEPLQYAYLDLEIVTDLIPMSGSLIGIYTGLFYSSNTHCFVAACDMPFLNKKVVEYMISIKENYDVVIPHLKDGYHPLHALYSKKCLKFIEELINEDNLKIIDFFNKVKVREITSDEMSSINPAMNSFLNINTPEDLETLKDQVKRG
ncbi:MAG: molybdenum cofactor guanylyltransferase, partial [Deltaproteobacteria bacterium]|nr:molybdenum cofactor guanylyltransferase [Deltaproteobacteria bacterium]